MIKKLFPLLYRWKKKIVVIKLTVQSITNFTGMEFHTRFTLFGTAWFRQ